jgi:hypothetical protein
VRQTDPWLALVIFGCAFYSACIIDPDARCGDELVLGEQGACFVVDAGAHADAAETPDGGEPDGAVQSTDAAVSEDAAAADAGAPVPTGLGAACSQPSDCAQFDATYCESFQTHQCMIEHCTVDPNDCPSGYECCDFSTLGLNNTLCVPTQQCPTR